jgi:succinate-semialdehyde dehydrogenase/glutarate-semialdehyde dehydrogenase
MERAGTPPGVVNVIPADRSSQVGNAIMGDPRVRKLSFTGSTEVGRILLAEASKRVLNTSMELGGNAPFLVLRDADVQAAVSGAMLAKMRNAGEACTAANRFYVHRAVAEDFSERLSDARDALQLGPALDQ